jgi:hypothetical protein
LTAAKKEVDIPEPAGGETMNARETIITAIPFGKNKHKSPSNAGLKPEVSLL